MISNLIVLISFSALVSLGVCKPLDLSDTSKQLYVKCSAQLQGFKTFISCDKELKPIKFHSDALIYVCLLSFNLILEACKQDLLSKIKLNVDADFNNQTCPINYVAKYNHLTSDLSEGINYLKMHCDSVCNNDKLSSQKCNFLNEVIKVFNEKHEHDELIKDKIPVANPPVSSERKKNDDLRKPHDISLNNGDKDLEKEFNNGSLQKKILSDRIASSPNHYQANKTDVLMKMNHTNVKGEKLDSNKEIKVDDNKKETNVNIIENKISNSKKIPGQKTLDDSVVESQSNCNFPEKIDKQDTMSISNPVETNTYSVQTEPGSIVGLGSNNYNLNNHEKDYRNDADLKVLADEGGGGDDDDDDPDPAAVAAAVSNDANINNNNNNNNNNNDNNNSNINDEEMEKSGMQDALPDREPPQLAKSINSKEIYSSDNFFQAEDSHFSTYFLMTISLIIIGYIIYHNKNKIVAYALEGRRNRNGRRRAASSASYRKLDCNLEEAIASNPSHASVTNVVY